MSNATSICGMPRGAGGMPVSWNLPSDLLYCAISRSPWSTWISTDGWLSSAVEKTSRLARRDRRVALDQLRHHAALGLDAEGERGDVEQQHVLDVAGQHAGLDRGADGHDLVRVDAAVRVLAGELLDLLLHGRHARHAADEHDVVDVVGALVLGVVERLADRRDGAVEQVGASAR